MKILMIKGLDNKFSVCYDSDYEKMKHIKANDAVEVEIKKPRNIKFHRKFFALIEMVYQNQERYNNKEELRYDLIVASGHYTKRVNLDGEEIEIPDSISFSKMDEIEFNRLYSNVIDVIIKYFNFNKQDILDNIEHYF